MIMIKKLKVTLLLLVFMLTALLSNAQDIPKITKNTDTIVTPPAMDSLATKIADTIPPKKISLEDINFRKVNNYILGGISVKGNQQFSDQSITVFSELSVGQPIKIPGDKLTAAIKKLWNSKLFSNVDVYVTNIDDNTIYLEFDVKELTKISSVKVEGIRKNKGEELIKETEFKKGAMLTENLLTTTKKLYQKEIC